MAKSIAVDSPVTWERSEVNLRPVTRIRTRIFSHAGTAGSWFVLSTCIIVFLCLAVVIGLGYPQVALGQEDGSESADTTSASTDTQDGVTDPTTDQSNTDSSDTDSQGEATTDGADDTSGQTSADPSVSTLAAPQATDIQPMADYVCQVVDSGGTITGSYYTLAEAVTAASNGATIQMLVDTYAISSPQVISEKNLTIESATASGTTTFYPTTEAITLFDIESTGFLTLNGVVLQNTQSLASARGITCAGTLHIDNTTLSGFCGTGPTATGCAITLTTGATFHMDGTSLIANCSGYSGVALSIDGATAVFDGKNTIHENTASYGAAIDISGASTVSINDYTVIHENTTNGTGAGVASGISVGAGATLNLVGGKVNNNTAPANTYAPGIRAAAGSTANVSGDPLIDYNSCNGILQLNLLLEATDILHVTKLTQGADVSVTATGAMARGDTFGTVAADNDGLGLISQDTNGGTATDLFGARGTAGSLVWDSFTLTVTKTTSSNIPADTSFTFLVRAYDRGAWFEVFFDQLEDLLVQSDSKLYEYFQRSGGNETMDSTGPNYGAPTDALIESNFPPGTFPNHYWSVTRYYRGATAADDRYTFLYSDNDINPVAVGQTVLVFKFDSYTGKYTRGLGIVGEKTVDGKTFSYIESEVTDSFSEIGRSAEIDTVISLKNGESSSFATLPTDALYSVWEQDTGYMTRVATTVGGVTTTTYATRAAGYLKGDTTTAFMNSIVPLNLRATKCLDDANSSVQFPFTAAVVYAQDANGTAIDVTDATTLATYFQADSWTTENATDGSITFPAMRVIQPGKYLVSLTETPTTEQQQAYHCDGNTRYALVTYDEGDTDATIAYWGVWGGTDLTTLENEITGTPTFENYSRRSLLLTKTLTGDYADKSKSFDYDVIISRPGFAYSSEVFEELTKMLQDPAYPSGSGTNEITYYYYTRYNAYTASQGLDSTGTNYGQPISRVLESKIPGLDNNSYYWKAYRYKTNPSTKQFADEAFYYIFTPYDISELATGTRVSIDYYDTATGSISSGKATVEVNSSGIRELDINSISSDSIPAVITRQDGSTENIELLTGQTTTGRVSNAISLKDGETLSVPNLSMDASFTITETDYSSSYTTSWSYNGAAAVTSRVCKQTSLVDSLNTVAFTNTKITPVSTGVDDGSHNHLIWLLICGISAATILIGFYLARRRSYLRP